MYALIPTTFKAPAHVMAASFATVRAAFGDRVLACAPEDHFDADTLHRQAREGATYDRWMRIHEMSLRIAEAHGPSEMVAICEHDVLYPPDYAECEQIEPYQVHYSNNAWRLDRTPGYAKANRLTSCAVMDAGTLVEVATHRLVKLARGERLKWDEPGQEGDPCAMVSRKTAPVIDVRHGRNLTGDRKCDGRQPLDVWGTPEAAWAYIDGYDK